MHEVGSGAPIFISPLSSESLSIVHLLQRIKESRVLIMEGGGGDGRDGMLVFYCMMAGVDFVSCRYWRGRY